MANRDDKSRTSAMSESEYLDLVIDAALAKYASIEPRAGLEQRVVANLRAGEAQVAHRAWWIWGFLGTLALALVVFVALAWRVSIAAPPALAVHVPNPRLTPASPESRRTARSARHTLRQRPILKTPRERETVASNPKLDVFPSPLPLSEQEKLLSLYVEQNPEHAALVAEARMADLEQQSNEQQRITANETGSNRE